MDQARILKEEAGPNGNVRALVEEDGRSVHLYLEGSEDSGFGIRSCWVRNLRQAPALIEAERMQAGLAPMLPSRYCVDPEGAARPAADDLEFLWFESGDGVALLEKGDILAVIPPWSGKDGFAGYARDCALESPLCDPLGSPSHDHHGIFSRLARAAAFWESWDHNPWPGIQDGMMRELERNLGAHSKYYSTDFERWPPRSLTRFDREDAMVAVTGGMSLRPQPGLERHVADPRPLRRIELGLAMDPALVPDPLPLLSYLSGQATLPWDRYVFLDEGHTIGAGSLPAGPGGARFSSVILWEHPPLAPAIRLPPLEGDPVRLLWMVPLTEEERKFAGEEGSEALFRRLREAGVSWIHRDRPSTIP